jgi:hypothetical protein
MVDKFDIEEASLGQKVTHKKFGVGEVIACTERPRIRVRFTDGRTQVFSKDKAEEWLS